LNKIGADPTKVSNNKKIYEHSPSESRLIPLGQTDVRTEECTGILELTFAFRSFIIAHNKGQNPNLSTLLLVPYYAVIFKFKA
jgi:hypothetical protein